jgi:hypothetical protein
VRKTTEGFWFNDSPTTETEKPAQQMTFHIRPMPGLGHVSLPAITGKRKY